MEYLFVSEMWQVSPSCIEELYFSPVSNHINCNKSVKLIIFLASPGKDLHVLYLVHSQGFFSLLIKVQGITFFI